MEIQNCERRRSTECRYPLRPCARKCIVSKPNGAERNSRLNQKATAGSAASSAEREFYLRLKAKLTRAVGASCPPWLCGSTDDIVQAALIRVWEIARKSEGLPQVGSSYLWKVAYSTLVDEIRKCTRRREVDLPEDEGHAALTQPAFFDPESDAKASEIGDALLDCVRRLLKTRRPAVTAYLHGHTVPETARLLGWTVKKTESLLYRGLADLRKCLASKGFNRV